MRRKVEILLFLKHRFGKKLSSDKSKEIMYAIDNRIHSLNNRIEILDSPLFKAAAKSIQMLLDGRYHENSRGTKSFFKDFLNKIF